MELKYKIILYFLALVLLIIAFNIAKLINFIISTKSIKSIIGQKINNYNKNVNKTELIFHPGYTMTIDEYEFELNNLGLNDFSLELHSLKNVTLKIYNLTGFYKFKYRIGISNFFSFKNELKLNINPILLNYTFNYDFFPFQIYYASFSFDIKYDIDSKNYLYKKIVYKVINLLSDKIKKKIYNYFKKLPIKLENIIKNEPKSLYFLLILIEMFNFLLVIIILITKIVLIAILLFYLIKFFKNVILRYYQI